MSGAWWRPRPTGDSGGDHHAVSIHYGCVVASLAFAAGIVRSTGWGAGYRLAPLVIGELTALAALVLNYFGQWAWAVRLAVFGALFANAFLVTEARDGFRSIAMLGFPGLLVIAVMLLRAVDYLLLASATLLTVTVLGVAEIHGLVPWVPIVHSPTDYLTVITVDLTLLAIAFIGGLLARDARLNLAAIRTSADRLAAANRELARSEAKYRSFIELAADAIFVTGRDGTILEVSRQASALTGIARERLLGASMTSILSPVEPEGSPFPLDLLEQGVPVMRPCRIGRPDGTVVEAEIHSAMLPEGPILCFCRDITERKQAEEERKNLHAQLLQAQKLESIGRLAGGVAHDFNNLLTLINGYSRLLLDAMFPGDPSRDSLEEIHKAGERAAELTRQLLAFSRKQRLQPQVFDLNLVVTAMRSILTRVVGEDLELCVELSAEAAMVRADPHQLEQVVMNLAVNARDAMAGGGSLRLETACLEWDESFARLHPGARRGRYALLAVSDTGTGMDEETRRHLFEPFFTTKEAGKGTGLGLAMVLGIVEQSGGFIDVASELGRGTSFRIHLPMVENAVGDAGPPAAVPVAATRGTETVLVVEDQAEVRKFAADALRSYGYHVLQAENALEAEMICDSGLQDVDLVLTDVVMPGPSGHELADWLAVHWPDIKVLFISGYAGDAIIPQGIPRQDAEFIRKPFSPSQLALKIREVLGAPDHPAAVGDDA
jgi:PAS domain S-box-containing protein